MSLGGPLAASLRYASHPHPRGFETCAAQVPHPRRFAFRKRGPNPAYVVGLRQDGVRVRLARMGSQIVCRIKQRHERASGKTKRGTKPTSINSRREAAAPEPKCLAPTKSDRGARRTSSSTSRSEIILGPEQTRRTHPRNASGHAPWRRNSRESCTNISWMELR